MNATGEVHVENQNYYQGRNYALQFKTTGKNHICSDKRRTLQNIIYPPKEKKKTEKNLLEQHLEVKVVWPTDPFLHY